MATYSNLRIKYPNRIPSIIEKTDIPINKKKFLIPYEMYILEFLRYILKHSDSSKSVIIFINGQLPKPNSQFYEFINGDFLKISILYNTTFG